MKKQMIAALIATMLLTSCAAQGTQTDSAQTAEQATPTATPEPALYCLIEMSALSLM